MTSEAFVTSSGFVFYAFFFLPFLYLPLLGLLGEKLSLIFISVIEICPRLGSWILPWVNLLKLQRLTDFDAEQCYLIVLRLRVLVF